MTRIRCGCKECFPSHPVLVLHSHPLSLPSLYHSLRSGRLLRSSVTQHSPVAGTETGDDDDERSRSGRRPVRSPLTHFFPHPPRGPVTHSRPSSLHSGPSFVTPTHPVHLLRSSGEARPAGRHERRWMNVRRRCEEARR